MKNYLGIIFSVLYALAFRILVEFEILEINSFTYLIIVPAIMGYIPFFLGSNTFSNSRFRSIVFPLLSVLLFLTISFITRLEDLGCFIILLPPYLLVSTMVSLGLRAYFNEKNINRKNATVNRNGVLLLVIPLVLGNFEKFIEKKESTLRISQNVIINCSIEKVWNQLLEIPNLTNHIESSTYNYLGFPNPIKSEYDQNLNIRLGYFSNGVILNESVIESKQFEKLSFKINVDKSNLKSSRTFEHILKNENLTFRSITYDLKPITNSKTELTLSCRLTIKSNVSKYGEFWSKRIISDFERKLLNALKVVAEK